MIHEILDVQARIVDDARRADDDLYDTVIGCRGGNWIYEVGQNEAMDWQQKACQEQDAMRSGRYWLQ